MSEWQSVRLGDLGEVNRGRSRHRPRDAAHLYGGPYPFIQTGDVKASNGRVTRHLQTYSAEGLAQSRLWPKDTMVITIAANIAETAILTYPACFPDSIVGFIADPNKADVRFIEYLFRQLRRKIQHENVGTGSVQDNINLQTIARLDLRVPSVDKQRSIARTLGALDDKIDLNRRMNETLEAMARAIFKDWFVDFGPTRAKMEGRAPYLAPEIWMLFPDRLDDEGKPEGWLTTPIKSTCSTIVNGGTPRRDNVNYWNDGTIPWLTSGEVRERYLIATASFITEVGLAESSAKWVDPDATVVALYGATAGQVSFVATKLTTNQAVCSLTPLPSYRYFNYLVLSSLTQTLAGMATGSAQQNLSKGLVEELQILVGDPFTMKKFDSILEPFFNRIISNEKESITLAAARDLLLPKLMSGEIRMKDAERIAESTL
jgi:type I restriction enzyme, S subunit